MAMTNNHKESNLSIHTKSVKKKLQKIGDSAKSSGSSCRIGSIQDMKEALIGAGSLEDSAEKDHLEEDNEKQDINKNN